MKYLTKNYGSENFLEFVSPDFKYFIDVDNRFSKTKQFIIRDVFTEEIVFDRITSYLMTYTNDPDEVILRFKWVGNDKIKIISKTGMEKLVDVGLNFI